MVVPFLVINLVWSCVVPFASDGHCQRFVNCCRKKNEFTRLWDKKNTMMSKHSKELENFSTCLERLKQIPLHPALKREGSGAGSPTPFQHTGNGTTPSPPVGSQPPPQPSRQTLWDCVPVAKLQSWASDCRERYRLIGATYAGTWLTSLFFAPCSNFATGMNRCATNPRLNWNVPTRKCFALSRKTFCPPPVHRRWPSRATVLRWPRCKPKVNGGSIPVLYTV